MNNKNMIELEKVKKYASEMNIDSTIGQYDIISELMLGEEGLKITPKQCKRICNLQRHCRMFLKSDEVAMYLESKWHGQSIKEYEALVLRENKL